MSVSVIISFFERISHLKCCLDALVGASGLFDEVIVSDDGSDATIVDRVNNLISQYPFLIRHVWQPKKGFRAAAVRNNGVRAAKGGYLVFLDCDFLLLPDAFQIHLSSARPGRFLSGSFKSLSELQTRHLFEAGVDQKALVRLYKCLPEDNLKRDHFKFVTRTWRIRMGLASPRKQVLGGHFSIYRRDFEKVNGFDERFVGWGGEDIDLGIRLAASGVYGKSVIRSARTLHMWHPREKHSDDWKRGANIAYFNRKTIDPVCDVGLKKLI
jgi:glycosyltransferase involved in cell wall biosynthesis